ncbi:ankyrin repeat domain-containing protein 49 [Macrosteles quadrilineatus]|uniref:ankyrin repeat domain-containing protein 49 n=1 Tax=Macrosteles quadrilineatus TaxID=74068 RepID=UPI0023E28001|nr:ankyrin repeat domain-containing protein 49 [Macrosteles quadrilineatus]XP_054277899.1 ankyrin repeat domain-containing protein 49 [Macrosteles quadrilineatus]
MADEEMESDQELLPVVTDDDIRRSSGDELGFVSGWDEDTDGVEEELNPHASPNKEILWAAENGENEIIKRLVKENPSIVHVRDQDGYTALHRACYNNHVETVELLIQSGANIAAKTDCGWQPLHSACKWNNAECAAKLLAYGADVNALTDGDLTPLHTAASNSYARDCLELLLMHHNIRPDMKNHVNETAFEIARRSGKYAGLFEITEPCFQL